MSTCVKASQVALVIKNSPANAGDIRDAGSIPGLGRSPGGGQPTPVLLPGESHGQRILVGYSPSGCKESDMTEATWRACRQESTHVYLNCFSCFVEKPGP